MRRIALYEDKENIQIIGYCVANWARSPIDWCSTIGYCVVTGGKLFIGKARNKMRLLDRMSKLR